MTQYALNSGLFGQEGYNSAGYDGGIPLTSLFTATNSVFTSKKELLAALKYETVYTRGSIDFKRPFSESILKTIESLNEASFHIAFLQSLQSNAVYSRANIDFNRILLDTLEKTTEYSRDNIAFEREFLEDVLKTIEYSRFLESNRTFSQSLKSDAVYLRANIDFNRTLLDVLQKTTTYKRGSIGFKREFISSVDILSLLSNDVQKNLIESITFDEVRFLWSCIALPLWDHIVVDNFIVGDAKFCSGVSYDSDFTEILQFGVLFETLISFAATENRRPSKGLNELLSFITDKDTEGFFHYIEEYFEQLSFSAEFSKDIERDILLSFILQPDRLFDTSTLYDEQLDIKDDIQKGARLRYLESMSIDTDSHSVTGKNILLPFILQPSRLFDVFKSYVENLTVFDKDEKLVLLRSLEDILILDDDAEVEFFELFAETLLESFGFEDTFTLHPLKGLLVGLLLSADKNVDMFKTLNSILNILPLFADKDITRSFALSLLYKEVVGFSGKQKWHQTCALFGNDDYGTTAYDGATCEWLSYETLHETAGALLAEYVASLKIEDNVENIRQLFETLLEAFVLTIDGDFNHLAFNHEILEEVLSLNTTFDRHGTYGREILQSLFFIIVDDIAAKIFYRQSSGLFGLDDYRIAGYDSVAHQRLRHILSDDNLIIAGRIFDEDLSFSLEEIFNRIRDLTEEETLVFATLTLRDLISTRSFFDELHFDDTLENTPQKSLDEQLEYLLLCQLVTTKSLIDVLNIDTNIIAGYFFQEILSEILNIELIENIEHIEVRALKDIFRKYFRTQFDKHVDTRTPLKQSFVEREW